ncbi:hypothetical protein EJB05_37193 [Eragrostis curvula]|uniref:Uncharacterized protein n=1 Tax=Eragrostis curvula TaxID=38414 RepID=A0A5J9TRC1_9POAL|nr:hypothetical protein EJB05_37193 [Eragrostis curvula]
MGNILNTVKRFSKNYSGAIPFQGCSNLPIEASRLNKRTCVDSDGSVTVKNDSVTKGTIDGCECFDKKVGNDGFRLTTGITSRGNIEQSGSAEADKNRGTQNETVDTVAKELGFDECSEKACLIYSQTADNMVHNLKDESTKIPTSLMISNDSVNKVCSRNPKLANELETSASMDRHKRKNFRLQRVSPADGLSGSSVSDEQVDVLSFGCKSSLVAAFEEQRHDRTQHKWLSDDTAPIETLTACATFDFRGLEGTSKTSLKRRTIQKTITTKASNQVLVSKENIRTSVPEASLKGRGKRKRTTIKASNQMFVPKENSGISVPSDVTCVEIFSSGLLNISPQHRGKGAYESIGGEKVAEKTFCRGLLGQERIRLHFHTLMLGSNILIQKLIQNFKVRQSPLTRGMAKALSISTPESMKRSRSGRLIVPRLDPGSQNIIYGPDGIIGVTNLELQCPRESHSEPPPKRRRSFRHLAQNHNRLLTF